MDTSTSYVTLKDTRCLRPSDRCVDSQSGISSPRLNPKLKAAVEVSSGTVATELFGRCASFFFGVYSWLVKVLGQFSIIYFRGLGLRIGVRVWVRVRVGVRVWVRVRVRVRVRVSVVLWSG